MYILFNYVSKSNSKGLLLKKFNIKKLNMLNTRVTKTSITVRKRISGPKEKILSNVKIELSAISDIKMLTDTE